VARSHQFGRAAHQAEQVIGEQHSRQRHHRSQHQTEKDRLRRRDPGALPVTFPNAASDHRCCRHAGTDGDREEDADHGFGEPDRGHGVGAEARHEEGIGEGEDRLHHHLEHHWDREQDDGAADWAGGELELFAGQGELDCRPGARVGRRYQTRRGRRFFCSHGQRAYAIQLESFKLPREQ
jgi:hypothetical protein